MLRLKSFVQREALIDSCLVCLSDRLAPASSTHLLLLRATNIVRPLCYLGIWEKLNLSPKKKVSRKSLFNVMHTSNSPLMKQEEGRRK